MEIELIGMGFDSNLNRILYVAYGNRTAKYETPLNMTRRKHFLFIKQYRLRNQDAHMNNSILMDFKNARYE